MGTQNHREQGVTACTFGLFDENFSCFQLFGQLFLGSYSSGTSVVVIWEKAHLCLDGNILNLANVSLFLVSVQELSLVFAYEETIQITLMRVIPLHHVGFVF